MNTRLPESVTDNIHRKVFSDQCRRALARSFRSPYKPLPKKYQITGGWLIVNGKKKRLKLSVQDSSLILSCYFTEHHIRLTEIAIQFNGQPAHKEALDLDWECDTSEFKLILKF